MRMIIIPNLAVILTYTSTAPRNNTLVIAKICDHVRVRRSSTTRGYRLQLHGMHARVPGALAAVAGVSQLPSQAAASRQVSSRRRRRRPRRRNLASTRLAGGQTRASGSEDPSRMIRAGRPRTNGRGAESDGGVAYPRDPALPIYASAHGDGPAGQAPERAARS